MSAVEAVFRRPGHSHTLGVFCTSELLIIPAIRPPGKVHVANRFPHKGDSGSAIFDGNGTIVGIVTAGNECGNVDANKKPISARLEVPIGTDVAFAQPIQRVLDDIEEYTNQKLQLVGSLFT